MGSMDETVIYVVLIALNKPLANRVIAVQNRQQK